MPTSSKLDVNQLAKDISNLEEPTSSALTEALQAVADERAGLKRLDEHIQARLDTLDEMESTLRSIGASDGRGGSSSTTRKRATKKATKKKATRKKSSSRKSSVPVGDIIEQELNAAGTALSMDQLAERVEQVSGQSLDRRGLAGALNGGVRSGRFQKTPTGSFKLPSPSATTEI